MANDIWTPPTNWNAGTDFTELKAEQEITDDLYALWLAMTGDGSVAVPHQHFYDTHANRPAAGQAGRVFYSSDLPYTVELDTGAAWVDRGAGSTVRVLDRSLATVDVQNTAVETTIYSVTIPANTLGSDGGFRVLISGNILVAVAGFLVLRVKLGATTVFANTAVAPTVNANRGRFWWEIVCMNSTPNDQVWAMHYKSRASSNTFYIGLGDSALTLEGGGDGVSSEDTTAARILTVTADWDIADLSLSFRKNMAIMELLPSSS